MKAFPKKLLIMAATMVSLTAAASGLTMVVQYKPYGVPESRRAEYESKLQQMAYRQQLLAEADSNKRPVAVVPEQTYDFGMLNPHTTTSFDFEIRNEGNDLLALQIRGTSCKCTAGNLRDDLLAPGESSTVTLTWNTGYQADQYEQTATLVTNDPLAREIQLTVRGEVRAECIAPERVSFASSDRLQPTQTSFVVFSQLWDDFSVVSIESDLQQTQNSFDWYAEPIETNVAELADKQARSAWRVHLLTTPSGDGEFAGNVQLTLQPNDGSGPITRTVACHGKVRSPISFYSPEIHETDGLDIGTLVSGKEHEFHVVVRARGQVDRPIEVLDVKPEPLQASLTPMPTAGNYRLVIKIPADCPMIVFNTIKEQGYVEVGDPNDDTFSNWFPIHGAIVDLPQ